MAASDDAPEVQRDAFRCPHCHAFAQQDWQSLGQGYQEQWGLEFSALWEPVPSTNIRYQWLFARCARCGQSSLWLDDRMIYPRVSTLPIAHEDMPGEVLPLYNEAREVTSVSRRAGAAMARATIEMLLKIVLPDAEPNAKLMRLIDLAEERSSSGLGDLLTYIRIVGNAAVHVDDAPDDATILVLDETTTEAVDAIFEAINEVVDEFITKPRKAAKFAGLIPDGARTDLAARRARRQVG